MVHEENIVDPQYGKLKASGIMALITGIVMLVGDAASIAFVIFLMVSPAAITEVLNAGGYYYTGSLTGLNYAIAAIILAVSVVSVIMSMVNIRHFVRVRKSQNSNYSTFEFYFEEFEPNPRPVAFLILNIIFCGILGLITGLINLSAYLGAKQYGKLTGEQ